MKLDHGNRILYIHQSDMATWRMCPEQIRYQLNDEYPDYDSDSAMIGTLTHAFIERCLEHAMENHTWPTPDQAEIFVSEVKGRLCTVWPTLWLHPHQVRDMYHATNLLDDICQRWYNEVLPQIDTTLLSDWEVEGSFDRRIGEVVIDVEGDQWSGELHYLSKFDVHLRGHIDFWDGIRIWDWKTGGLREEWRKHRYDIQSTVYTWAKSCHTMRFCHVPRGETGHKILDVTRLKPQWGMMLTEAMAIARHVLTSDMAESWTLGPTDWWCSERWCAIHAQGKCMGAANPIYPEEAVHLTGLIERGVPFTTHGSEFDAS